MYVTVVQPNASEALIEEAILINEDPAYVPERNLFVVVKDLEQEACFVHALAIALMSFKARETFRERSLLGQNLIPIDGLTRILPKTRGNMLDPSKPCRKASASAYSPRRYW